MTPNYQSRPVPVHAVQLTREAVEAHLFDGVALPVPFVIRAADTYPPQRRITYLKVGVSGGADTVPLGGWLVTRGDVRTVLTAEQFEAAYEPIAQPEGDADDSPESVLRRALLANNWPTP